MFTAHAFVEFYRVRYVWWVAVALAVAVNPRLVCGGNWKTFSALSACVGVKQQRDWHRRQNKWAVFFANAFVVACCCCCYWNNKHFSQLTSICVQYCVCSNKNKNFFWKVSLNAINACVPFSGRLQTEKQKWANKKPNERLNEWINGKDETHTHTCKEREKIVQLNRWRCKILNIISFPLKFFVCKLNGNWNTFTSIHRKIWYSLGISHPIRTSWNKRKFVWKQSFFFPDLNK